MNGRMLNMLLAEDNIGGIFGAFPIIKTIMIVIMILCALFIICVVLFQPSNSSGVGALGGTTETFLSKNKGKTNESKLRKMTIVSGIVLCVLAVAFCILSRRENDHGSRREKLRRKHNDKNEKIKRIY